MDIEQTEFSAYKEMVSSPSVLDRWQNINTLKQSHIAERGDLFSPVCITNWNWICLVNPF